ncbi:MAG: diguanylate cyclase [Pseudomonadales bacterium]
MSRKDEADLGLPNRRFLDESLNNEWKRAQRSGAKLALLMMDIDFFKSLNDIYGHLHGDECLKKVASALNAPGASKQRDFVARYGGEEFVLVATDVEKEQACQLAQHIREGIKTLAITHVGNPACEVVTVSIGIAIAVPANTPGPWQQLLNRADLALYQAKEQGRDRFVVDDSLCHLRAGNEGQMT